jgi:hypothetical protein
MNDGYPPAHVLLVPRTRHSAWLPPQCGQGRAGQEQEQMWLALCDES